MNPRQQGDIGELSAINYLTEFGAAVATPLFHSPDWDLIAEFDGCLARVQVKTSNCFRRGRYEVAICTRGGNQSWNGLVKRFSPTRCDYLFVLVGDGRRWFIPADAIQAGTGLRLGGPKYAQFEVEPGHPFAVGRAA